MIDKSVRLCLKKKYLYMANTVLCLGMVKFV